MPYTKQLINNRNLFLTVREAEKSKIKQGTSGCGSWGGPLLGHRWGLLPMSTWWKNQGALWGLFYKDTNPNDEGFALISESAPNTLMLEVKISTYEFRGRHKNPDIGTKNHFLWQTVNLPKHTAQHTSFMMNTS